MTTLRAQMKDKLTASPDEVFALLTDIDRLPQWNTHIQRIVEAPSQLSEGSQWVVTMSALGTRWDSRSTALTVDPATGTFAHRTQTEDGNPSYALWTWRVKGTDGGSEVTVGWELNPKTVGRRVLLARIRHRQLKRELRASLASADRLLMADRSEAGDSIDR